MAELFAREQFERVIHLGAQAGVRYSLDNPFAYADSNLTGTLTVLEGCRHHGVKHLVYASSSSVYGLNEQMPFKTSDGVDHPVSLYAASKKANELMAHSYSHLYGLPTTGLRFFTVYGPWGRPDMALFKFVRAILKGEPIDIYNQGQLSRDFTHIDDIVEGIVRIADRPPVGDPNWQGADRCQPGPLPPLQHRQRQPGAAAGLRGGHRDGARQAGDPQPAAHAARRRARHLGRHRGAVRGDRL